MTKPEGFERLLRETIAFALESGWNTVMVMDAVMLLHNKDVSIRVQEAVKEAYERAGDKIMDSCQHTKDPRHFCDDCGELAKKVMAEAWKLIPSLRISV